MSKTARETPNSYLAWLDEKYPTADHPFRRDIKGSLTGFSVLLSPISRLRTGWVGLDYGPAFEFRADSSSPSVSGTHTIRIDGQSGEARRKDVWEGIKWPGSDRSFFPAWLQSELGRNTIWDPKCIAIAEMAPVEIPEGKALRFRRQMIWQNGSDARSLPVTVDFHQWDGQTGRMLRFTVETPSVLRFDEAPALVKRTFDVDHANDAIDSAIGLLVQRLFGFSVQQKQLTELAEGFTGAFFRVFSGKPAGSPLKLVAAR